MKNQTLIGSPVDLPGWLQATGWGLLSACGLLIGAVGGYYTRLQHTEDPVNETEHRRAS